MLNLRLSTPEGTMVPSPQVRRTPRIDLFFAFNVDPDRKVRQLEEFLS